MKKKIISHVNTKVFKEGDTKLHGPHFQIFSFPSCGHAAVLQQSSLFPTQPSFQWKFAVHGKLRRRMHTKVST